MLQMAVAMDVVWSRGVELSSPPGPLDVTKRKRAVWGADAQKVVQLMMGQLRSPTDQGVCKRTEEDVTTLDLLGCKTITSSPLGELDCNSARGEFLELDPDQPLPCGWEKCLDLKVGLLCRSLQVACTFREDCVKFYQHSFTNEMFSIVSGH